MTIRVQHPSQCDDGYLEWYLTISHPHIIPPTPDVVSSGVEILVEDCEGLR